MSTNSWQGNSRGPALILFDGGLSGGAAILGPLTAALAEDGRVSVPLDIRPQSIAALLDAAGIARAHLIGYDVGATTAEGIAAHLPDRVASLVLLNPAAPGRGLRASIAAPAFLPAFAQRFLERNRLKKLLARDHLESWINSLVPGGEERAPATAEPWQGRALLLESSPQPEWKARYPRAIAHTLAASSIPPLSHPDSCALRIRLFCGAHS